MITFPKALTWAVYIGGSLLAEQFNEGEQGDDPKHHREKPDDLDRNRKQFHHWWFLRSGHGDQ